MATIGIPFTSSRIMETEPFFLSGVDSIVYRPRLGLEVMECGTGGSCSHVIAVEQQHEAGACDFGGRGGLSEVVGTISSPVTRLGHMERLSPPQIFYRFAACEHFVRSHVP